MCPVGVQRLTASLNSGAPAGRFREGSERVRRSLRRVRVAGREGHLKGSSEKVQRRFHLCQGWPAGGRVAKCGAALRLLSNYLE